MCLHLNQSNKSMTEFHNSKSNFCLAVIILVVLPPAYSIPSYGLSFQGDGVMSDDSVNIWARLEDTIPELTTFSICTWVKFTFERTYNQIWSYCVDLPTSSGGTTMACNQLVVKPGEFTQDITDEGFTKNTTVMFRQFRWNLVCGAYKTQGDLRMVTTLYFNGVKLMTLLHDTAKARNKWYAGGEFFLGQDQDEVGGGFEKQQSLSGVVSNLNMWDRILTDKEVERMSKCFEKDSSRSNVTSDANSTTASHLNEDSPLGNILNWNEAKWELSKVQRLELDTSDFCIDFPSKNYFMFPERRSLESGQALCAKMGGSVSTPLSKTENEIITQLSEEFFIACDAEAQSGKTTWIGIVRDEGNKWADIRTLERIIYAPWKEGQGFGRSNCAYLFTGQTPGKWGATFCSDQSPRRVCTACEFYTKKVLFSLRGLCVDSRQDRIFTLERQGDNKPYFKGLSTSVIQWNDTQNYWHLNHLRYRAEANWIDETKVNYPIGRQKWRVFDRKCGAFTGTEKDLTLTICGENEFTCSDGTCQPLVHRCDLKADCFDRSDEELCHKVIFKDDYEKDLAPKHTRFGKRVDDPLPVYLGVDILSFDKIDTVNMMISVMLRLNITWRDRRVDYLNLRDDIYQNLVPRDEFDHMWIPEIGFFNAKTGPLEADEHEALMIRRDSEPEPFDSSRPREDYVYEGYKNSLMYLRRYYAEYHCTFNLRFFPFDEQTCKMEFKARTVTKQYLELRNGGLKYRGPKAMVEFVVSNITMGPGRLNVTRSELKIVIQLHRQYAYHLSQSFFQSFLLGFLAYLTFWIDVSDFTDRFMGSLTALLVLASLMSTLTESLPKTSYFKVIDFWLLFFLLSTSCNIAVHVLVDRFYQSEVKKRQAEQIVKHWHKQVDPNPMAAMAPPGDVDLYDKLDASYGGGKKNPLDAIITNVKAGIKGSGKDSEIGVKSKGSRFRMFKTNGWTAQGINDFQKTLFPLAFCLFTLLFALCAFYKVGDIEQDEL